MMDLLNILAGGANLVSGGILGGIVGAVSSIGGAVMKYKMKKLEMEREAMMYDKEIESMKVEAELAVKKEQAITEREVSKAEAEAFKESYSLFKTPLISPDKLAHLIEKTHPVVRDLLIMAIAGVELIRRITRPFLTAYALIAFTYFAWHSFTANSPIANTLLNASAFLAGHSFMWWFGDRMNGKLFGDDNK